MAIKQNEAIQSSFRYQKKITITKNALHHYPPRELKVQTQSHVDSTLRIESLNLELDKLIKNVLRQLFYSIYIKRTLVLNSDRVLIQIYSFLLHSAIFAINQKLAIQKYFWINVKKITITRQCLPCTINPQGNSIKIQCKAERSYCVNTRWRQ